MANCGIKMKSSNWLIIFCYHILKLGFYYLINSTMFHFILFFIFVFYFVLILLFSHFIFLYSPYYLAIPWPTAKPENVGKIEERHCITVNSNFDFSFFLSF